MLSCSPSSPQLSSSIFRLTVVQTISSSYSLRQLLCGAGGQQRLDCACSSSSSRQFYVLRYADARCYKGGGGGGGGGGLACAFPLFFLRIAEAFTAIAGGAEGTEATKQSGLIALHKAGGKWPRLFSSSLTRSPARHPFHRSPALHSSSFSLGGCPLIHQADSFPLFPSFQPPGD